MCGRYTLKTPPAELAELFGLGDPPALAPRYNIAPTQPVPAVRSSAGDGREWALLRWGLVPGWADDPSVGNRMINARAETVAAKAAFRNALKNRRCLVAADGFYEWKREGRQKQPFHIRLRGGGPFAFAGLWERWTKGGEPLESCTFLTTGPNELMQPLHDRMPVIIAPEDFDLWLDPAVRDAEALAHLLRPFPAERMEAFPVSKHVNSPTRDDPACAAPLPPAGEG